MRIVLANIGYFCRETVTLLRQALLSNLFSILSIFLIFFLLSVVSAGWRESSFLAEVIQGEAQVSVFFNEGLGDAEIARLTEALRAMAGVREVRMVDRDESYRRMAEILGDEADVLKVFSENPFSPFLELKIDLNQLDSIVSALGGLTEVDHVQNNKVVLERLGSVSKMLRLFGGAVFIGMMIATTMIIYQMIRLGIENNSELIKTLRLLGAPEYFIAFPFFLEGLLLTVSGGVLAISLSAAILHQLYDQIGGQLIFLPLVPLPQLLSGTAALVLSLSIVLGLGGSLLGLAGARK